MKKKKIKDPKKVAAGKARHSLAIRDSKGKFISPILYNEIAKIVLASNGKDVSKINAEQTSKITELISISKITKAQIKDTYESNRKTFNDIIKNGEITGTSRNSNQIEKTISDFKGDIFINEKKVNKSQAKMQVVRFKQFLSVNINVVDFTVKPTLTFDGKIKFNIPNVRKLVKDLMEYFGVENVDGLEDISGAEISEAIADLLGDDSGIVIYAS